MPVLKTGYLTPLFLRLWVPISIIDNFLYLLRIFLFQLLGFTVVCDRYFYDRLVGFEYYGYSDKFLSMLYLCLTPHPTIAVFLDLDASIAHDRETEDKHSLEFLKAFWRLYTELFKKTPCLKLEVGDLNVNAVICLLLETFKEEIERGT